MSRLTKKLEIDVPLSILYKLNDYVSLIDVINKLGELEDLLEKHDIDSIEELERKINKKSFVVFAGGRHSGKTLMTKGLLYERLSEKLGCPLEIVFEGMNDYYVEYKIRDEIVSGLISSIFKGVGGKWIGSFIPKSYILGTREHYTTNIELNQYQKTWWLKGEKENE